MKTLVELILEIILIILKGTDPKKATFQMAVKHNLLYEILWELLPEQYKK